MNYFLFLKTIKFERFLVKRKTVLKVSWLHSSGQYTMAWLFQDFTETVSKKIETVMMEPAVGTHNYKYLTWPWTHALYFFYSTRSYNILFSHKSFMGFRHLSSAL